MTYKEGEIDNTSFMRWLKKSEFNRYVRRWTIHAFRVLKEQEPTSGELDYLLRFFVLEIRTFNGNRFKSSTVKKTEISDTIPLHTDVQKTKK